MPMPIENAVIKSLPIFSSLQPETNQAIAQRAFSRDLPACYTLTIEGAPAESCYFLLSGDVRVLRMSKEGRIQVLARLTPGSAANIISLLKEEKINRGTIETLTPVTVLVLRREDIDHLVLNYPDFVRALLNHLAERLTNMTDLASGLSLYSVRSRLAQFLIQLGDSSKTSSGWTQDEIAAHIGTVRDVVGRILRDFEANGLIKRQRQQIILLDREGLYAEADRSLA